MKPTTMFAFVACVLLSTAAFAAAPSFSGTWLNSQPLKVEGLRGKVVVLYYYEEGCPSCRAKWPGHIAASEQFKNDPVVFIAVNSGNEPERVASYMSSVGCDWPTLADTDRSFEKASDVGTISLRNIYQAKIITPEGRFVNADTGNLAASVQQHLPKATWKVDPKTVPASMKAAWKAMEFGDYTAAMPVVKRMINSKDEQSKAAAEAMDKAITADLDAILATAAEQEKAGEKWAAYKAYDQAATAFKGHPKASEATAGVKRLAADKELKDEIKAWTLLERAQKALGSRNRQEQRSGESMLEAIAKQYAETDAGAVAQKMIAGRSTTAE